MDQPGKVANPARGQLNRENNIPLSPCVPENLVSRDGSSRPVPRQPAHLHTQSGGIWCLLTGFLPSSAAAPIYETAIHTPSGQSRVYRVTQFRTDGVHCRESAGTGPVNLKQGSSERVLPWQITMNQLIFASLSKVRLVIIKVKNTTTIIFDTQKSSDTY